MPRPIDADALLPNGVFYVDVDNPRKGLDELLDRIINAPTLDYAPVKRGEWVTIESAYWQWKPDGAYCVSRKKFKHEDCGKVVAKKEPYCPNCGALMDGVEKL